MISISCCFKVRAKKTVTPCSVTILWSAVESFYHSYDWGCHVTISSTQLMIERNPLKPTVAIWVQL